MLKIIYLSFNVFSVILYVKCTIQTRRFIMKILKMKKILNLQTLLEKCGEKNTSKTWLDNYYWCLLCV